MKEMTRIPFMKEIRELTRTAFGADVPVAAAPETWGCLWCLLMEGIKTWKLHSTQRVDMSRLQCALLAHASYVEPGWLVAA